MPTEPLKVKDPLKVKLLFSFIMLILNLCKISPTCTNTHFHSITEVWDYAKYGCPKKHGDHYYYYHNSGLQNQRFVCGFNTITNEQVILNAQLKTEE